MCCHQVPLNGLAITGPEHDYDSLQPTARHRPRKGTGVGGAAFRTVKPASGRLPCWAVVLEVSLFCADCLTLAPFSEFY